jgi:acyl-coenzyme A thioesterase PaaI-like protein
VRYGERSSFALASSGLRRPFPDEVGVVVQEAAAGVVRVEVTDYIRNSFGAVNGGVVASVAAEAAHVACRPLLGEGTVVADVVVHYLTQGRVGPLVTQGRVVRSDRCGALVRVEVADAGDPDPTGVARVMVVAHVHCLPGLG